MADPRLVDRNVPSAFQNSGVTEVISYRFYDTLTVANGSTTDQTAFATPATQDNLGNFEGTGALPAGQAFHAYCLRVFPNPAARWDDIAAVLNGTVLKFTKENAKRYAWGPSAMFPAGMGLALDRGTGAAVQAAPATDISFASNGVPVYGNKYQFHKPVTLFPQQNFKVVLTPFAPTLNASVTVRIIMEGILERNLI